MRAELGNKNTNFAPRELLKAFINDLDLTKLHATPASSQQAAPQ
jgi:hypothetical protein